MSDATYRIDVRHDLNGPGGFPFCAHVYRMSDDALVGSFVGNTAAQALESASGGVRNDVLALEGFSVFVDDQGEPVEQHSVKA